MATFNYNDPQVAEIINSLNVEISNIPADKPFKLIYGHFGRLTFRLEAILSAQIKRDFTGAERMRLAESFANMIRSKYTCDVPGIHIECNYHPSTSKDPHYYELNVWRGAEITEGQYEYSVEEDHRELMLA